MVILLVTIATGMLLLTLPGLVLQALMLPLTDSDWSTRLAIWMGASVSLYPIILVWANVAGIHLGSVLVWVVIVILLALLGMAAYLRRSREHAAKSAFRLSLPDVVMIVLLVLLVSSRLWVLRDVTAPMWGDSVQHAMINQLLVDNGGVFNSWLPYAPYATFTVHLGFHSFTAFLMWMTGADVLTATLVSGQLINIGAVVVLIPLAKRIFGSPWAGVGVVLVAGLLSPLPAGYVNWGRYPQLAGQVVLPVVLWLLWRFINEPHEFGWRATIAVGFVGAGMFLNYYRMPHYAFLFAVVCLVLIGRRWTKAAWGSRIIRLLAMLAVAALLVLPWLLRLSGGALAEGTDAAQSHQLEFIVRDYLSAWSITPGLLNPTLLGMAILCSVWVIMQGKPHARTMAVWGFLLAFLPLARVMPVPGVSNLQVFSVLVSLCIPICLLVGFAIDTLLARLQHAGRVPMLVALTGLACTGILGTVDRVKIIDSSYSILTNTDMLAMQWIRSNVPQDALFLVDGFLVYDESSAVGSDGGWWIPLLAQRRTTMPPQYPLLAEQPIDPAYNDIVVQTVSHLRQFGVTSTEGIRWLCQIGVTHLYIGQQQGRIGTPPPVPMLSADILNTSPQYTLIYHADHVAVYALNRDVCH